jgi:regulatory protein
MRILKPNKSSSRPISGEQGDLLFSIEEINLDQKNGALDWMKQSSVSVEAKIDTNTVVNAGVNSKEEYKRVWAKGIRLLSMREHSTQELLKKLSAKCDTLDLVHAVIDDLTENNYLSDQRFTESFVRSRQNRGIGPSKIKLELKGKGISSDMIDDHLNGEAAVWFDNARNQYFKKYGESPVSDYSSWAKRARFMQSRGFSNAHIQATVPRVNTD